MRRGLRTCSWADRAVIGRNGMLEGVKFLTHALGFASPEAFSILAHRESGDQLLLRTAGIESGDLIKPDRKGGRLQQPEGVSQSYGSRIRTYRRAGCSNAERDLSNGENDDG